MLWMKDGRTVLHAAVGSSNDHIDTLQYLIDHGVDINAVDEVQYT
jgi:ankyrin repeat protein